MGLLKAHSGKQISCTLSCGGSPLTSYARVDSDGRVFAGITDFVSSGIYWEPGLEVEYMFTKVYINVVGVTGAVTCVMGGTNTCSTQWP
jgi:hypothetical protein